MTNATTTASRTTKTSTRKPTVAKPATKVIAKLKAGTVNDSSFGSKVQRGTARWRDEANPDVRWQQQVITCSPEAWKKMLKNDPSLKDWSALPFTRGIIAISPPKLVP
jgi:hypothetical protein